MRRWMFAETYRDNHFTIYVNQAIMVYILNVYSDVYQLFLSKTGVKNKDAWEIYHFWLVTVYRKSWNT